MTVSDTLVLSSATGTGFPWLRNGMLLECNACSTSFTPIKASTAAKP